MGQTLSHLLVHLVFSTGGRLPHINEAIEPRLHAYMGGICRNLRVIPIEIGGTDDHVHALIRIRTDTTVASVARDLKANASRWMHEQGVGAFEWQNGYAAFSVSESVAPRVVAYIKSQREHHRVVGFMDELREICRRHGVEIDENHAWH